MFDLIQVVHQKRTLATKRCDEHTGGIRSVQMEGRGLQQLQLVAGIAIAGAIFQPGFHRVCQKDQASIVVEPLLGNLNYAG